MAYSVVILRRRHPEWERPYRVPLYPLPVAIFVLVAAVFVLNTLVESTRSSLYGLVIQALGVVFYFAWRASAARAVAPAE